MTAPTDPQTAGTKVVEGVHVFADYAAPAEDDQRYTDGVLADLFEALAAGHTVRLGEFSGGSPTLTMTDVVSGQLIELYLALREGKLHIL